MICSDIRKLDLTELPHADGFLYGFPCNDFSNVGETRGFGRVNLDRFTNMVLTTQTNAIQNLYLLKMYLEYRMLIQVLHLKKYFQIYPMLEFYGYNSTHTLIQI